MPTAWLESYSVLGARHSEECREGGCEGSEALKREAQKTPKNPRELSLRPRFTHVAIF
jgi:hypothetical protein